MCRGPGFVDVWLCGLGQDGVAFGVWCVPPESPGAAPWDAVGCEGRLVGEREFESACRPMMVVLSITAILSSGAWLEVRAGSAGCRDRPLRCDRLHGYAAIPAREHRAFRCERRSIDSHFISCFTVDS